MFGITRQVFHKREKKETISSMEREVIFKLVMDVRKEMPRLGTYKVHFLIKKKLADHNIKSDVTSSII